MKELQTIVQSQIESMIQSGAIEEMIQTRLNTAIKDSIDTAMRSYGDFGKSLEAKISESLNGAINNVSLPEYNKFIADTVHECYGSLLSEEMKPKLQELLEHKLSAVPDEISFDAICEQVKLAWGDECRGNGHEEIEIQHSSRNTAYEFKFVHPEYESESITITCYNHSGDGFTIGYINEDRREISSSITGATHAMGIAGFFYRLYCNKTKITGLDEGIESSIYFGWD
ncbi:hypothetical protein [Photobacterium halotolerans]|uniref:Gp42 n=1 Tax=Photobacterium halotolerans TaxID=265726 RepID=A0A7X4W863_9GAMM|nr:hypothetical protein [Photobacterium halotolerans]NAW63969.1 hypothetical protein [Photobacterium halotolerans]